MMNDTNYTFWQLIRAYKIEIPIIQRDYAQGRSSAKEIRTSFLDAIHTHLEHGKRMDVDFVYGSIDAGKFIPLDGQQRLTTLFLLHWYLANKEGRHATFAEVVKNRFSYETRASSRMFCDALISHYVNLFDLQVSLSEHLKDQPWFFFSWQKDPTISAMLTMLDALHLRFKLLHPVYDKIISEHFPLVTFQFIELKEYGLTDKLYIKMNARGKSLTRYESFKAQLEGALGGTGHLKSLVQQREFAGKLDGIWTDLFWNYRNGETKTFDDELLNFFRTAAICVLGINRSDERADDDIDFLRDPEQQFSFKKLEEMGGVSPQYITYVSQTLDNLCNGNGKVRQYFSDTNLINESVLFENAISDSFDYVSIVLYYAFTRYLNCYRPQIQDDPQLASWMRVVRNLVEGSRLTYYNSVREFRNSIQNVESLIPHAQHILEHLTSPSCKFSGFVGIQIEEEILKAHLLLEGENWAETILPMENHGYFKGQIGFLLKFAGITDIFKSAGMLIWDEATSYLYLNRLKYYYQQAASVFGHGGLNAFRDFRWERALLAIGNYMLRKGQNYSFLNDIDRDISWKRLLRDDNQQRNFLKILLDQIDVVNIEASLKKVIDNFDDMDDWRYYFIQRPQAIEVCGKNKTIRYNHDGYEVLLLERSRTSAYHRELYSYALMSRLQKAGNTCEYEYQRSYWQQKFIKKINNQIVKILYGRNAAMGQWCYSVRVGNKATVYFENENEVVSHLETENLIKQLATVAQV